MSCFLLYVSLVDFTPPFDLEVEVEPSTVHVCVRGSGILHFTYYIVKCAFYIWGWAVQCPCVWSKLRPCGLTPEPALLPTVCYSTQWSCGLTFKTSSSLIQILILDPKSSILDPKSSILDPCSLILPTTHSLMQLRCGYALKTSSSPNPHLYPGVLKKSTRPVYLCERSF